MNVPSSSFKPFTIANVDTVARVDLRPAKTSDHDFCLELYIGCMRPLFTALDAWDALKAEATFNQYFVIEEISIVRLDQSDIGYLQVSKTQGEMHLDQLHLLEEVRGLGIGTQLIKQVIASARKSKQALKLVLVQGNRAEALYRRLGFCVTGECSTKRYMSIKQYRRSSALN